MNIVNVILWMNAYEESNSTQKARYNSSQDMTVYLKLRLGVAFALPRISASYKLFYKLRTNINHDICKLKERRYNVRN
jgi:homogentisate 1,2-dioxygenase